MEIPVLNRFGRFVAESELHVAAGGQKLDTRKKRAIPEEVLKREIFGKPFDIQPRRVSWKRAERLVFRGKNKRPIDLGVVDRFHAEAVAGNSEPFFLGIPDSESEHAVELKQGVEAPLGKCLQQNFTVAGRVEGVAPRRQLQLQLLVIVDFPVVG